VQDAAGRSVIVAGHHRAAAALLMGRPLLVRTLPTSTRTAVTPLLSVDGVRPELTPAEAVEKILRGNQACVGSADAAGEVLIRLGLTAAEIRRALDRAAP
jgi:hypothetical protein